MKKIDFFLQMLNSHSRPSLRIRVENSVQLSLIVSPRCVRVFLSVFFVATVVIAVITKNQRYSSVRIEFRKIFIVFENTQNLARSDVWVFSKTINNFRNSTLTDECRLFLVITDITTVATKKTRPKNSNASWRNNQDKLNTTFEQIWFLQFGILLVNRL